jgi:hypothetical protein
MSHNRLVNKRALHRLQPVSGRSTHEYNKVLKTYANHRKLALIDTSVRTSPPLSL